MKKTDETKSTLKLKLDRETLRALETPELKEVAGGIKKTFGSLCIC
jgi:hypothetical protein